VRFTVDPWDPSYGIANEAETLDQTKSDVRVDVEMPESSWRPVGAGRAEAARVALFVDGVRRVEARVWIDGDDGSVRPGICASFAAGVVICDGTARVGPVIVERGLFSSDGFSDAVVTKAGVFTVRLAASDTPEGLSLALQERMGAAEVAAAELGCAARAADLVVIDGPLRGRAHLPKAVGYVKTHHVAYLPPELHGLVGRLAPGERSPLFVLGTSWSRLSWYLRLPGDSEAPWAGVVRCECSPDVPTTDAIALADQVSATLPRYASEAHKDSRAPQNLYPIAGLERELRRRMGDSELIYRALRKAARSGGTSPP